MTQITERHNAAPCKRDHEFRKYILRQQDRSEKSTRRYIRHKTSEMVARYVREADKSSKRGLSDPMNHSMRTTRTSRLLLRPAPPISRRSSGYHAVHHRSGQQLGRDRNERWPTIDSRQTGFFARHSGAAVAVAMSVGLCYASADRAVAQHGPARARVFNRQTLRPAAAALTASPFQQPGFFSLRAVNSVPEKSKSECFDFRRFI